MPSFLGISVINHLLLLSLCAVIQRVSGLERSVQGCNARCQYCIAMTLSPFAQSERRPAKKVLNCGGSDSRVGHTIYSLVVSERSDFLQQKKSHLVFRNEYRFTKEHSHTNLNDLLHTGLPIDCSKGGLIYCSPVRPTIPPHASPPGPHARKARTPHLVGARGKTRAGLGSLVGAGNG